MLAVDDSKPSFIRKLEKHAPKKHEVQDFYAIELLDSSLKDDAASMEAPIYSLSKVKDKEIWTWESVDGKKRLRVIPSAFGRATIFDKDVLIYVTSCLVKLKNAGLPPTKTVRFGAYEYLKTTGRGVGGSEYLRLVAALGRLKGTTIETNIKTDNKEAIGLFSLVEKALLIKVDGTLEWVEVTLSDWLFNAIDGLDVLTINPSYFELHRPLERRLYEIARKHCACKASWLINFENLVKKAGSRASGKEFKRMLKQIIEADSLPDYRMSFDGNLVKFYQKDQHKLAVALGVK